MPNEDRFFLSFYKNPQINMFLSKDNIVAYGKSHKKQTSPVND